MTSVAVQDRSTGGPDFPMLSRLKVIAASSGAFIGEDQAAGCREVHAHALHEAGAGAGNLAGGLAAKLADGLLHGEHPVHTGVGVGQASAARVLRKRSAGPPRARGAAPPGP